MLSLLSPWGATAGAAIGSAAASAAEKLSGSLPFADLLQTADQADAQGTTKADPDSLRSLTESALAKLDSLQQKLAERLQAAGITLDGPLPLEVDAFGDLRVNDGHVAADQIELVLNNDPDIRSELKELQALTTEVERLELAQRADRLHDLDPRGANELRRLAREHRAKPPQLVIPASL